MRLYIISRLRNKITLQNAWSLFTKYFSDLKLVSEEEEVLSNIYILRKDKNSYGMQGKWKYVLSQYLELPLEIRIYTQDEYGYLKRVVAKFENDREKYFDLEIEEAAKIRRREFLYPDDEVVYTSRVFKQNESELKRYKAKVYKVPDKESDCGLILYKNKKYISIKKNEDWNKIFNLMGKKFSSRPSIELDILNGKSKIDVKGLIHIVGALGAGKSTFKYATGFQGSERKSLKDWNN